MRGHDITEHNIAEQPSRVRRAGLGGRRVSTGPRPARPGVVPVGVRPVQPARPESSPLVRRSSALALLGASLLGAAAPDPAGRSVSRRVGGQRLLARRVPAVVSPVGTVRRARGVLAVAALMVTTAAAAVLLGLLADAAAELRAADPVVGPGPAVARMVTPSTATTVTVEAESTVWEVAQRIAPEASGPELAAVVERIVADNALSSVRVHPGQELRVTAG